MSRAVSWVSVLCRPAHAPAGPAHGRACPGWICLASCRARLPAVPHVCPAHDPPFLASLALPGGTNPASGAAPDRLPSHTRPNPVATAMLLSVHHLHAPLPTAAACPCPPACSRIVAVTGEEAEAAIKLADELAAQVGPRCACSAVRDATAVHATLDCAAGAWPGCGGPRHAAPLPSAVPRSPGACRWRRRASCRWRRCRARSRHSPRQCRVRAECSGSSRRAVFVPVLCLLILHGCTRP